MRISDWSSDVCSSDLPDVVYSYFHMDDGAVLQLHERLGPSVYEEHSLHDRERFDAHSFRPKYGAEPLQSLSTIFRRSRHRDHRSTAGPLPLLDVWFTGERSEEHKSELQSLMRISYAV